MGISEESQGTATGGQNTSPRKRDTHQGLEQEVSRSIKPVRVANKGESLHSTPEPTGKDTKSFVTIEKFS